MKEETTEREKRMRNIGDYCKQHLTSKIYFPTKKEGNKLIPTIDEAIYRECLVEDIPLKRSSENILTDFLSLPLPFHKCKKCKL